MRERALLGHSAATLHFAGVEAPMAFALAGAEPTPLHRSVTGAIAVATNRQVDRDEGVKKTGLTNGIIEVARHPSSLQIPFRIRGFSTLQMMTDKENDFPDGRFYLPASHDEFGFGGEPEIIGARRAGIIAGFLGKWHNSALLHPRSTAQTLHALVNAD